MNRKKLKPYGIAVLLVVLYAIDIFWLSDFLGAWMGLLGTVVSEALLVGQAAEHFPVQEAGSSENSRNGGALDRGILGRIADYHGDCILFPTGSDGGRTGNSGCYGERSGASVLTGYFAYPGNL